MSQWVLREAGVQNLRLEERPVPTPGVGEIVVRVAAVSLNYRDLWFIAGDQVDASSPLPATPASDLAGTVVGVGAGVKRFAEGDDVLSTFWGGWIDGECPPEAGVLGGSLPGVLAQYVVLNEAWAVRAPRSLDAVAASTLPCAGLTAWFALVEKGAVRAGQTVVIQGTGGVALFGLQLARAHGAQVIVTTSSAAKAQRVLELGATHAIDRNATPEWDRVVRELTGARGADHVFELAGGENLGASVRALRQGGRISLIGTLGAGSMSLPSVPSFLGRPTIQGIGVGHRRAFEELVRAVDALALKPVVDQVYAFDELPAALAHLERGAFGKVVVRVAD
ncbi:NAD(P)-dependent alcohol dehydrogenase [Paraburkholderia sp. D15]|uniref:zinc-dependent alcohol dehydrogenase family protein n=1 Tax=Paraburkholderia sp. D15 TaxID=2880218 RepID=UPI002479C980|nr:NAD(P)-dependent alcohol dehydrogenase [Paraburkholderia sp. D15]WGS48118.1 NAD(P)-dependent alcohol dehydrogenase [Paraburkholderia sp. D15]